MKRSSAPHDFECTVNYKGIMPCSKGEKNVNSNEKPFIAYAIETFRQASLQPSPVYETGDKLACF